MHHFMSYYIDTLYYILILCDCCSHMRTWNCNKMQVDKLSVSQQIKAQWLQFWNNICVRPGAVLANSTSHYNKKRFAWFGKIFISKTVTCLLILGGCKPWRRIYHSLNAFEKWFPVIWTLFTHKLLFKQGKNDKI